MSVLDEYSAFQQLTEGLQKAVEACERLAVIRGDQDWRMVGQTLTVSREICFRIAGEGKMAKQ